MSAIIRSSSLRFFITGTPVPKGSIKSFMRPGMKFPVVTHDNLKSKPWASLVTFTATQVKLENKFDLVPAGVPLRIDCTFYMPRPKGHYGSGRNATALKASAPQYHTSKPDRDKLLRNVCDALKGVLYADDSQLVAGETKKMYCDHNHVPGVDIHLQIVGVESAPRQEDGQLL